MDLKLDNLCAFRNFHVNFRIQKDCISYIEHEHLDGLPNFRYKESEYYYGFKCDRKDVFRSSDSFYIYF